MLRDLCPGRYSDHSNTAVDVGVHFAKAFGSRSWAARLCPKKHENASRIKAGGLCPKNNR